MKVTDILIVSNIKEGAKPYRLTVYVNDFDSAEKRFKVGIRYFDFIKKDGNYFLTVIDTNESEEIVRETYENININEISINGGTLKISEAEENARRSTETLRFLTNIPAIDLELNFLLLCMDTSSSIKSGNVTDTTVETLDLMIYALKSRFEMHSAKINQAIEVINSTEKPNVEKESEDESCQEP